MTFLTRTDMQGGADGSLSDLLAQGIAEQFHCDEPARRARPHVGMLAVSGTSRDGGWPISGGDAPTAHAILEAGGFPCLIPALPLLAGCDPAQLLSDDHTFALLFDGLWPIVRQLDGLVFTGGGDLSASLYGQQPHPQAETPDRWREMWERTLARLTWVLCMPTLGIGRGMHLMNVVLGGTLYQDLRTQWPTDRLPLVRHRASGRVSSSSWVTHPVHLAQPDRLLPSNQPRQRSLLRLMPLGMAVSLAALGLPFLQAPWWLALSLASYTLADAIWSILLPRLTPGLGPIVMSQRHLLPGQSMVMPNTLQRAYRQACEAQTNLLLATCEGLLIAAFTPVVGWVIDWRGSVDAVLVMVGLVFLLGLVGALGGHACRGFARRPSQVRAGLTSHTRSAKSRMFPKVHMPTHR